MLHAKAYGQSRALLNESPLLVDLDISIAALREGLSLTAPATRQARRQGVREYFRVRRRLNRSWLRNELRNLKRNPNHG